MAKVVGQYHCGCSYGPVEKSKRLRYCGVHGDDIQNEYKIPSKKFSYSKWAKKVAAAILHSDLDSGFEVADATPNREKAICAMEKLIEQLEKQGT